MSSGGKYYITLWGGIGDFLKSYYSQNDWKKLENFKKQNPNTYIKAIVYSLNPTAKDVFTYHPAIDEMFIPQGKFMEIRKRGIVSGNRFSIKKLGQFYANDCVPLDSALKGNSKVKPSHPIIYLSEADKEQLKEIFTKITKKFVVIHPFSAMDIDYPGTRTIISSEKYIPIIQGLAKKGYQSIVLGATRANRDELFEYEDENTINLVSKINIRVALSILKQTDNFIGTNSCFMCYAFLEDKKCFVITNNSWKKKAFDNGFMKKYLAKPKNKIVFLPEKNNDTQCVKIQNEAIDWFN